MAKPSYAYLIVARETYEVAVAINRSSPHTMVDRNAPFAVRLRRTLDVAAQLNGYVSLASTVTSKEFTNMQATDRAAHVRELVRAGLLSKAEDQAPRNHVRRDQFRRRGGPPDDDRRSRASGDVGVERMMTGVVPEFIWQVLKQVQVEAGPSQPIPIPTSELRPEARVETRTVPSWRLALQQGDGITEIEIDPHKAPADVLPLAEVTRALDWLAEDGWEVIFLSEDRTILDDASRNTVVAQRYLLGRG